VRHTLAFTVAVVVTVAVAWTGAKQPQPAASTAIDEVLQAVRADLQNDRADTMAKNLTLTSDQGAKFWPMFRAYQQEQSAIIDEQLKGVQRFIESFDSLDDAGALALINGHFDRDARMNTLRQKWLGRFRTVIGTKLAVRAMQIDRRLSLTQQLQIAAKIPLVH